MTTRTDHLQQGSTPGAVAETLVQRGDWHALANLAAGWVRVEPGSAPAWQALSRSAWETGRFGDALGAFDRVVALSGRSAANLVIFGRIAMHALDFDVARAAFDEADESAPDMPELLAARAMLFTYLGRFAEAEQDCRRCLAVSPEYIPAYTTLGRLNRGRFSDAEMAILSRVATHTRIPVDFRIPAAFALATGFDARDDTDHAFEMLQFAHGLGRERNRSEGRVYEPAQAALRTDRLVSLFSASLPGARPPSGSGPTPLFIVGMPRSGTTLLEGVLAAHSRVTATGERPGMQQLLETCLGQPSGSVDPRGDASLQDAWRQAYLAGIDPGTDHFTDKHPLNFEAIGLIATLFPGAPILHVRRDPMETCLSIYRNEFSKFWAFTDRLEDLGHFYGQYARLMAHWDQVLGDRFRTVQYEQFAGDFTREAPRLVAACGLDWEASCGAFQETVRVIPTFSAVSAREAVHVRRGAAVRYRRYLGPLREALDAAGVDPETGALRAMTRKPL